MNKIILNSGKLWLISFVAWVVFKILQIWLPEGESQHIIQKLIDSAFILCISNLGLFFLFVLGQKDKK